MPIVRKHDYESEAARLADFKKHVLEALDKCLAGEDPHVICVLAANPHEQGDEPPQVLHLGCSSFMQSVGRDLQAFGNEQGRVQVSVLDLGDLIKKFMKERETPPVTGKGGTA